MSPQNSRLPSPYSNPASRRRRSALTRRRFLQASTAALSGVALSNCRRGGSGSSSAPESGSGGDGSKLHIYTWANYIDDELLALFQERTGIEVIADVYDSNEVMLAKLSAGGGKAYSIIYPSDYILQDMVSQGLLSEIDHSRIPGFANIFEKWQDPSYDANNTYSVPVSWGTTGLVYNSELLETEPTDWDYLWENQDILAGKITLLEDVREVMGAALKSLGYSYNATDPAEIQAAYERLVELKPALATFTTTGWINQLLAGDLLLSMGYSPDASFVAFENPALKYVIPESGSSIWTDTMVIPEGAPNVDAAYEWINFMFEPEVAAPVAERLYFATPNQLVFDQISEEAKSNPSLFPPQEVVNRCEGVTPVGDAIDLYTQLWTELTST